jgi:hypothetical protein
MDFTDEPNEKIKLPEIPKLVKKFKCEFCGKEFKSKKGYQNHVKKFHSETEEKSEIDYDNMSVLTEDFEHQNDAWLRDNMDISNFQPQNELNKLKKELENLILNNPSIDLERPVNTTFLERINNMSVEELKARIFNAKRELNGKLDLKISDGALSLVNQVIGRILGCCEELEQEVMKDQLLRESTKEMMSMNLLSKIPSQVKVAGLYSLNVGSALNKKKSKQNVENNV